jgi:hypothetical protein
LGRKPFSFPVWTKAKRGPRAVGGFSPVERPARKAISACFDIESWGKGTEASQCRTFSTEGKDFYHERNYVRTQKMQYVSLTLIFYILLHAI